MYRILFSSVYFEVQFFVLKNQKFELQKNRAKALPDRISVKRNDKNIRQNQGKMSSVSRKISGGIREFRLEIAVAAKNFKGMSIHDLKSFGSKQLAFKSLNN